MTAIVGIVQGQRTIIAGDSCMTDNYTVTSTATDKVFRRGAFVFGVAGSMRAAVLMRYGLVIPKVTTRDMDKYVAMTLMDAIRECLTRGGAMGRENVTEEKTDYSLLIGYQGRLWDADGANCVTAVRSDYNAIGSGREVALGALHATHGKGATRVRAYAALAAAEAHARGVRRPWVYLVSEAKE